MSKHAEVHAKSKHAEDYLVSQIQPFQFALTLFQIVCIGAWRDCRVCCYNVPCFNVCPKIFEKYCVLLCIETKKTFLNGGIICTGWVKIKAGLNSVSKYRDKIPITQLHTETRSSHQKDTLMATLHLQYVIL